MKADVAGQAAYVVERKAPEQTVVPPDAVAVSGVMDAASVEQEPYIPCRDCDQHCLFSQQELPTFAEVREMAAGWSRY